MSGKILLIFAIILLSLAGPSAGVATGPPPAAVSVYDMRYTLALPLADAYEEQALAAAATGLANRGAATLVALLGDVDDAWLAALRAPGGWLASLGRVCGRQDGHGV